MKWEEYKEQEKDKFETFGSNDWIKTEITCPECGSPVYKNMGMTLASYPSQHQYKCISCNWMDIWY